VLDLIVRDFADQFIEAILYPGRLEGVGPLFVVQPERGRRGAAQEQPQGRVRLTERGIGSARDDEKAREEKGKKILFASFEAPTCNVSKLSPY